MAVPFEPASLTVTGTPARVLDNVMQSFDGAAQVSVSRSGSAVYVPGVLNSDHRRLVTVDRTGTATPLAALPRSYVTPRLSPNGQRLLVTIEQATSDLWTYDIGSDKLTQITFESGARFPVWSPDGQRAAFSSNKAGALNLFLIDISRPGTGERLTSSENLQVAGSWSPDGQALAFVEQDPSKGRDIRLIAHAGPSNAISVTYLIPIFAIAWGALFLGESVTWPLVGGCAVVFLGTALATGILRPRIS